MKFLLGVLFSGQLLASNGLIVKFQNKPAKDIFKRFWHAEVLVPSLNLYKVKPPYFLTSSTAIEEMRKQKNVTFAGPDVKMTLRSRPSDARFSEQWPLINDETGSINAVTAWNFELPGLNIINAEPVVAIIDAGFDIEHEDLKDNIWVNKDEIPGNDIDDDQNGYIDDVNGWNAYDSDGDLSSPSYIAEHGTHVSGITGARGDNGLGIAGVSWKTRIMPIAGSSSQSSTILKAYGYVLEQKKLWLKSNGEKGANVVGTNSSFGVDRADCNDEAYQVWNDIYDELGEYGILSAVATTNYGWDIDEIGDVPSGCKSDYLITVTNTTIENKLEGRSGFGKYTIDIGAPGTDVLSTLPDDDYGFMTGTSMATPHVAGSIAFLHSVASESFLEQYRMTPAQAALELKNILLDSVDEIETLRDVTTSGGRLNLDKAAEKLSNY